MARVTINDSDEQELFTVANPGHVDIGEAEITVDTSGGDLAVTLAGEAVVLGAGSAAIGKVDANVQVGDADASAANPVPTKGFLARFDVALTLDTNIYAANDLLADTQAVASVFLNGNPVVLYDLRVLDEDDQGQAIDILFLRSNTSLGTENLAYAPTDAMGREILKKVSILAGDFVDEGAFRSAYKSLMDGIGCVLQPTAGTTLYIAAVCRSGTPTYTAAGVRAQFGVFQAG